MTYVSPVKGEHGWELEGDEAFKVWEFYEVFQDYVARRSGCSHPRLAIGQVFDGKASYAEAAWCCKFANEYLDSDEFHAAYLERFGDELGLNDN